MVSLSLPIHRTILLAAALAVSLGAEPELAPEGQCHIQNQALMCKDIDIRHLDLVQEELLKISKEHPSFGIAFDKCDLEGFPEDLLRDFNVTTFGYVSPMNQRKSPSLSYLNMLLNLRSEVTHLYLIATSIGKENVEKFRDFPFKSTLRYLDLRYNVLDELPSGLLMQFPQLEEVNMMNNKIRRLASHSFSGLEKLQRLNLAKNAIAELEDQAFYELTSLTHLDLSFGNFSVVPQRPFVRLGKLQSLNLQYNKFSGLEEGVLNDEDLPSITEVKLHGIPFICECQLQWLKSWLVAHDLLEESGAKCIIPKIMAKFEDVDFCKDDDDDEVEISTEYADLGELEQTNKDEL